MGSPQILDSKITFVPLKFIFVLWGDTWRLCKYPAFIKISIYSYFYLHWFGFMVPILFSVTRQCYPYLMLCSNYSRFGQWRLLHSGLDVLLTCVHNSLRIFLLSDITRSSRFILNFSLFQPWK